MSIHEIWSRVVKTRYTRALEAEVTRLRNENRALLNSILGIAGIPPVLVASPTAAEQNPDAGRPAEVPAMLDAGLVRSSPRQQRRANTASVPKRTAGVPAAVRHRSWQQVNRMLEFDASRKREQALDETAKTPGQT